MRLVLAASLLPLAALAGCGFSEEAARNTFRESTIQGCLSASREKANPATSGLDWQRICTCITDKIIAGKSTRDLLEIRPGDPEQREATMQCLAEIGVAVPGATGTKPTG